MNTRRDPQHGAQVEGRIHARAKYKNNSNK